MTVLACWLVFPLLLALVSAGLGLLGEWAGRFRLPTSLLLPWGFALLVLLTTLATLTGSTAGLATPGLVVLAVAGFVLGGRRRKWAVSGPGIAAVIGVFAVAAAPVVLTGQATFAGYTQLDDISTFLAFAARAIEHGRDLSGLAPSTYEATLAVNFGSGYPLGAIVPLPTVSPLVGQDLAWLWQPYLTFMLAVLALSLWALARPVVRDPRLRALAVFLAAQPALLYAYALQGSVKELAAAALIAFAAAAGAELLRASEARWRLVIPIAVPCAGLVCVLSVGAVAYVAPLAAFLAVAALGPVVAQPGWRRRFAEALRLRAAAIAVAAAVALGAVIVAIAVTSKFLPGATSLLKSKIDIGNLFHPLDWKQLFGIWPAGDFRNGIGEGKSLAWVLIAVVAAAGLAGVGWTLRRRQLGPALLAVTVLVALVGLSTYGSSPWVEAKALAIAAPAVMLMAVLGATMLVESRRLRVVGAVALAAIAGGVLWSNWLAYRDVKLGPRDRLAELAKIDDRFAGQGPTMINEYEPYGARYFLRKTDPEAPAELRRRVVPLRGNEAGLGKNQWAPLDEFLLPGILTYRTIVERRSPAESRPPVQYKLRWSGRYYDVWQRAEQPTERIVTYSIFGDQQNASALPPCGLVQQLAATARKSGARMVAAVRAPAVVADLSGAERPASWPAASGPPTQLYPDSPGSARVSATVTTAGINDIWVQGSFARGLSVWVDGARVGSTRNELSFTGQWIRFGSRALSSGRHEVELRYPSGSLRPGSGQQPETVGPVALVPRAPRSELLTVAPADARSLCTKPLDWLEVVSG